MCGICYQLLRVPRASKKQRSLVKWRAEGTLYRYLGVGRASFSWGACLFQSDLEGEMNQPAQIHAVHRKAAGGVIDSYLFESCFAIFESFITVSASVHENSSCLLFDGFRCLAMKFICSKCVQMSETLPRLSRVTLINAS